MGIFTVSQKKEQDLKERMLRLGLREEDLRETFVRSSGPGGQKVNKTSSCVVLLHLPTGLAVKCQEARSQSLNRFLARRRLAELLERRQCGKESPEEKHLRKIRKQKQKRLKRARQKNREVKTDSENLS